MCTICAIEHKVVPCKDRKTGKVCWLTKRSPDDEDAPITDNWIVLEIERLYDLIVSLSPPTLLNKRDRKDKKATVTMFLPSLSKMDFVLDNYEGYDLIGLDKFDVVRLIAIMHRYIYNSMLRK